MGENQTRKIPYVFKLKIQGRVFLWKSGRYGLVFRSYLAQFAIVIPLEDAKLRRNLQTFNNAEGLFEDLEI